MVHTCGEIQASLKLIQKFYQVTVVSHQMILEHVSTFIHFTLAFLLELLCMLLQYVSLYLHVMFYLLPLPSAQMAAVMKQGPCLKSLHIHQLVCKCIHYKVQKFNNGMKKVASMSEFTAPY